MHFNQTADAVNGYSFLFSFIFILESTKSEQEF